MHATISAATRPRTVKYGQEVPNSYKDAANMDPAWFTAEDKENNGLLSFDTWERIDQALITPDMRRRALRAHRIYDVKRSPTMRKKIVLSLMVDNSTSLRIQTRLALCLPYSRLES